MRKKEQFEICGKIAKRAADMNLLLFDNLSLMMDLECVSNQYSLNLERLLEADDFNFTHDIVGIQNNLNRETKQLENCFLPRFVAVINIGDNVVRSLLGTMNAGFEIIEQGSKAVVGHREKDNEYVAWNYHFANGQPSYDWGRYGDRIGAYEAFCKKEAGLYSGE